ncbi:Glutathione transport system permease protein GsiC [Anaerolineae bacterium]|nr:Glutathione transport system permease protein GsiC [Anaerolineae bacterium]
MARVLAIRILRGIVTLALTLILVFVLLRVLPSDPAALLLRNDATEEQIEEARHFWGLDRPIHEQFIVYLSNLVRGDAGNSFQYTRADIPAVELVASRIPNTIILSITALLIACTVSIPLGVITSMKPGSLLDNTVFGISFTLTAFPGFFVGMLLILFFALQLRLVPTGGNDQPTSIILPAVTLALPFIVTLTRVTRTEMGRILRSDYIITARAKGLRPNMVMFRHALRNAMIPLVTMIGLRLGGLLGGAVIVETLFRWPGLGSLMIQSILSRDYPVVQVLVPQAALMFILANLFVDILYGYLDPRIRTGG